MFMYSITNINKNICFILLRFAAKLKSVKMIKMQKRRHQKEHTFHQELIF